MQSRNQSHLSPVSLAGQTLASISQRRTTLLTHNTPQERPAAHRIALLGLASQHDAACCISIMAALERCVSGCWLELEFRCFSLTSGLCIE